VIGILTTLEEWRFAWFPYDNQHFVEDNWASIQTENFFTPLKARSSSGSPPGNTPSQSGKWAHSICDDDEDLEEENELPEIDRTLNVTRVLDIYENFESVLQHICTALKRMSQVKLNYNNGVSRVLFKLHKDQNRISFHPSSSIQIDSDNLCCSNFPRSTITSLIAVEDLGRGSSGKAWLTCTCTKTRDGARAICVLKYGNKESVKLEHEKRMWDILYPEFNGKIRLELWSGSFALMMPHFCSVKVEDREMYKESIEKLLKERFHDRSYIHQDVRWRNIGFYIEDDVNVPVLYDLESVRKIDDQNDSWVEIAINNLYPNQTDCMET
jgi:hypothetical protein